MTPKLKALLQRVEAWPVEAQEELVHVAQEIEHGLGTGAYRATPEELSAIDEADRSGTASAQEVQAALAKFRAA